MNRKRVMKKMLSHFNINLPVKWFSDYAVELDPDTYEPIKILVQHPDTKPHGSNARILFAQDKWTKNYLASHNLKMSYHAFAILHEIGHIKSKQGHNKEYHEDLIVLEKLYCANLIDEERYISLYNNIKDEKNANEWAINWVKNNKKLAIMLDKQLN